MRNRHHVLDVHDVKPLQQFLLWFIVATSADIHSHFWCTAQVLSSEVNGDTASLIRIRVTIFLWLLFFSMSHSELDRGGFFNVKCEQLTHWQINRIAIL